MVRSAARRVRAGLHDAQVRLRNARAPVILMYHRVAEETFDPWGLAVTPRLFEEQMRWLKDHRQVLALHDIARALRAGDLAPDAIAITFDDGYACTHDVAVPLLEKHALPATVFLSAGLVGQEPLFWWDELRALVLSHPKATVTLDGRTFALGETSPGDSRWQRQHDRRTPRQRGFLEIWSHLQPLPGDALAAAMAELRAGHPFPASGGSPELMTADQVRAIQSERITIGCHGLTHASLPTLSSAEQTREIVTGLAACEKLAGARPTSFAYPFGDFDADSEAVVATAGFTCACTVEPRAVRPGDKLFRLPRVQAGNWSARRLKHRLAEAAMG